MSVTPDYVDTARRILQALEKLSDREDSVRLIAAQLGSAFAAGGIKALDMVVQEVDKL